MCSDGFPTVDTERDHDMSFYPEEVVGYYLPSRTKDLYMLESNGQRFVCNTLMFR
jgi:hypothetical protein